MIICNCKNVTVPPNMLVKDIPVGIPFTGTVVWDDGVGDVPATYIKLKNGRLLNLCTHGLAGELYPIVSVKDYVLYRDHELILRG